MRDDAENEQRGGRMSSDGGAANRARPAAETSRAPRRRVGRPPRRDDDPAAERNRWEVLRAAARAFMQHGYASTSIDTVADVLGATKGRVYYYYRSKADLFFDLHRVAMEMNLDAIRPIATGPGSPSERLERMILAHVKLVLDELPLQCVSVQGVQMHLAGSTTPTQRKVLDRLIEARDEYERHFIDVMAEGIVAGEFRDCDPRTLVKPLLGALNWMTIWYRPRPGDTEERRRHIAHEHAAFLMRGLLS